MGTYTGTLKFYKPDPTEFVDVETQLNRNWDITDKAFKRLLEYEYTTLQTPDIVDSVDRARFYKSYSNSAMAYFRPSNIFYQDPGAYVASWSSMSQYLTNSYVPHPDFGLHVRTVESSFTSTKEIEWTGAVWLGGSNLPVNTTVSFASGIPSVYRPVTAKYFMVYGGNTASDFSVARIAIFTDGVMQFTRYGAAAGATSDDNKIEFTGIKFTWEVTGT